MPLSNRCAQPRWPRLTGVLGWPRRADSRCRHTCAVSDVPSLRAAVRGRHRAWVRRSLCRLWQAPVTRRVAMAAFGGALVGLVEVLTDRSPGSAPAAQTPVATPTTSQVTTAARATVPPATATVTASATSPVATATRRPPSSHVGRGRVRRARRSRRRLDRLAAGKNVALRRRRLDARDRATVRLDVGAPPEMASTVRMDILVATFPRRRRRSGGSRLARRASRR
jgi:hypothetical protein